MREIETAHRAPITAAIRVVVVEYMAEAFKAEADVVPRPRQREVLLCGPGTVMREERPRIGVVQEIRVAGDRNQGRPAIADVLAVAIHAGKAERAAVELTVVETGDRLALPGPAEQAIPQEPGREDVCAADRRHLGAQRPVADAAAGRTQRCASARAESRVASHCGIHDGVFAPHGVARGAVPVDLGIKVVPGEPLRTACQEIGAGSGQVRQRDQILDFPRDRALPAYRDDISRKGRASSAAGAAGGRVIDRRVVFRKIPLSLVGRGHGKKVRSSLPFADAFPAEKEEYLVPLDRPAHRDPVHVVNVLGLGGRIEEILGLQPGVVVQGPRRTMEVVGAGFGDHGDRRSAGHALLGIEVIGRHIHGLDCLRRRNVRRVVRQPQEDADCAVDASDIVVAVDAVHVGG